MEIHFIEKSSEPSLVAVREIFPSDGKIIFATISPNPKVKIPITRRWNGRKINAKMPYGKLPQKNQFDYCIRILKSSYNYSHDTQIYGGWELNKSGNIHLHLLMYDPNIQTNEMLQIFQRDVLNSEIVFKNLSRNMTDYCNNIVFVNDSINERLKYIHKSNTIGKPFPFYYSNIQFPTNKCQEGVSEGTTFPHDAVLVPKQQTATMRESETEQCCPFHFDAIYSKELDAILWDQNIYKKALLI